MLDLVLVRTRNNPADGMKPRDVSVHDMHRLMRRAQAVRVYKKIRHTLVGHWEAPLRRTLSQAFPKWVAPEHVAEKRAS